MATNDRSRRWDGGYVRTDSRGRSVYYIHRRIDGHLYEVSTRATTSGAAHAQLKRFEADPSGYRASGALSGTVALTPDLVASFLTWSRKSKGNSGTWVRAQQRALAWWRDQLGDTDLRKLKGSELAACLDSSTARKQCIATLKFFCRWLIRERRAMEATENPTAGLTVPQSRPEQWTTPKTFTKEQFDVVRGCLAPPWSWCADVLAGTGKHASELERFILGTDQGVRGRVESHPQSGARVLAFPQTKSGEPARVEVSEEVAKAAEAALAAGTYDYFDFREALRAACGQAGLKKGTVSPGTFRHSVATWAVNAGAPLAEVSAFLGHKAQQTTRRFYSTHAVPGKVPTLR